jgi:fructose-1,6-bisphosphatase/inositol monophosphatase family enzyme
MDLLKTKQIGNFLLTLVPEIIKELRTGFSDNVQNSKFGEMLQDVTLEYDRKIGQFVGSKVIANFQDVLVDSEEVEDRMGSGNYVLRIDPIDGSKHFAAGIPIFSSIFSLSYEGQTLFSLIVEPFSERAYWAFKDSGAYLNGRKITVNNLSVKDSFVFVEHPQLQISNLDYDGFYKLNEKLFKLMNVAFRIRDVGNFGIAGGLVAQGAISAFVNFSYTTKLYDIEGPAFIIQESGGLIGDLNGNIVESIKYDDSTSKKFINANLICANPKAYREIVEIVNS